MLRELSLKLQNLDEKLLPLSNIHRNVVKVDDVLDLSEKDYDLLILFFSFPVLKDQWEFNDKIFELHSEQRPILLYIH